VLNDADTWKDPHCFRPERHLNVDMTKIVKNENHIPFGVGTHKPNYPILNFYENCIMLLIIGKRMCLGEPLTRNSYFLFTSALVKTFDFSAIPGQPLPTLEPVVGFTSAYDGFKAVAKPRSGIPTF
jgi:cytochrome P450